MAKHIDWLKFNIGVRLLPKELHQLKEIYSYFRRNKFKKPSALNDYNYKKLNKSDVVRICINLVYNYLLAKKDNKGMKASEALDIDNLDVGKHIIHT